MALTNNGKLDMFENIKNMDCRIHSVFKIVKNQFQCKDVEYCITFLCCSSNLINAKRQKVMEKHKSNHQKTLHAKRQKQNYVEMEPAVKKEMLV